MNQSKLNSQKNKIKSVGVAPLGDPEPKRNTQSGITLVALIITVVVLLILAMVSIRLVMNGGIIDRAEKGTQAYSDAEVKEQIKLAYSEWETARWDGTSGDATTFVIARLQETFGNDNVKNVSATDGKVIAEIKTNGVFVKYSYDAGTGTVGIVEEWTLNQDGSYSKGNTSGVQVGDVVHYETILNQTANAVDSQKLNQLKSDLATYSGDSSSTENSSIARDNLEWKVLDVKDGKIRLISSVPTSKTIKLNGANGYNNAVYLIDEACSTLYASNKGTSQNLKIEDIEEKLSDLGIQAKKNYISANTNTEKYGDTREYTVHLKYPKIYANEIGCKAISTLDNTENTLGLSEQLSLVTEIGTAINRLKVTQTFWKKTMEISDFKDSKYYMLFINNGANLSNYLLSSRCVGCCDDFAAFYIGYVQQGLIDGYYVSSSWGYSWGNVFAFRPVITLDSNVQLTGDSINGWTIQ